MKQDLTPHDLTVRDIVHMHTWIISECTTQNVEFRLRKRGKGMAGMVTQNNAVLFENHQEMAFDYLNKIYIIYHTYNFLKSTRKFKK